MRTRYPTEEDMRKRRRLEAAGDQEALNRYIFGSYIRQMRVDSKLTQKKAADLAKITRQEWNRIEKGHHLPRPSNIPIIADVLGIPPAALFKKAGYEVPREFQHYDMRQAKSDLEWSLRNSKTLVAFFVDMEVIWQEFHTANFGKPVRTVIDIAYAEIMANILERFSVAQQLELARDIVKGVKPNTAKAYGINNQRFFDYIDKALAGLSEQLEDRNPPLLDNEG